MNSIDVGRRRRAPGVTDTTNRYIARGSAYRQTRIERGIGHAISVAPESEVYRFGTAGLLTSTERVVYQCLSSSQFLLSRRPFSLVLYSVVESPVCRCSLVETLLKDVA